MHAQPTLRPASATGSHRRCGIMAYACSQPPRARAHHTALQRLIQPDPCDHFHPQIRTKRLSLPAPTWLRGQQSEFHQTDDDITPHPAHHYPFRNTDDGTMHRIFCGRCLPNAVPPCMPPQRVSGHALPWFYAASPRSYRCNTHCGIQGLTHSTA